MTKSNKIGNTNEKEEKENDKAKLEHDLEDIVTIIGFGRVQVQMTIVCGMVLLMGMNELMGISVITIASQCDFELSDTDKGVMYSVLVWGKITSSYFFGYLSDKYGRRTILVYTNLAGVGFSFATMFVPNYIYFVVLRFCIGLCTGGTSGITFTYLAEFSSSAHRPFLLNLANLSNGISYVYVPVAAWLILLMDWRFVVSEAFVFRPWRLLIFFNLLPGLISSIIMLKYPEPPKFLLAVGRRQEAYDALDWICRKNRNGCKLSELNVYNVKDLSDGDSQVNHTCKKTTHAKWLTLSAICKDIFTLLKPPHVLNFLAASVSISGAFIISFGLAVWYPEIQNIIGSYQATSHSQTVCDIIIDPKRINSTNLHCSDEVTDKSLLDFMVYGTTCIVVYIILGLVINPRRRKGLVIFLLTIAGCCGIALIWLKNPTAIVITFSLYLVLSDLAGATIIGFLVDLLPTKLCGQGFCLIMTSARVCGALSTYIIGFNMLQNCVLISEIFAGMMFVCAVLAYFLKPLNEAKVKAEFH